tara:strand:+ start:246 stop:380 length:135 start_codon:yes stop_codon:yes gene_type:complete
MTKEEIKKRIKYLKSELAHEGYHDGWVIKGMREELEKLEKNYDK